MNTKLILGTVQLGIPYGINNHLGQPDPGTAFEILHYAFESGIDILDTAEAYGVSQKIIGLFHKSSGIKFKIISKLSPQFSQVAYTLDRIGAMIRELEIDSMDICMLHHFKMYAEYPGLIDQLVKARDAGLIKKTGVSIYSNEEAEELCSDKRVDVIQLPYNLFDNDSQRGAVIRKLKASGKEVHVRSVFLQGLFFKESFEPGSKIALLEPYVQQLRDACNEDHFSVEDIALQYAIQNEYIDKVLIGVDSKDQLKKNVNAARLTPPEHVFKKVNNIHVRETELLNPTNWQ